MRQRIDYQLPISLKDPYERGFQIMDKPKAFQEEIQKKDADYGLLVQYALNDKNILDNAVQNLRSKQDNVRYNSYNILEILSENDPEILYDYWNFFIEQLRSTNTFYKFQAIHLTANLTKIDTQKKFDAISEEYFNQIHDKSIVTVNHLILASGRIIKYKSQFRQHILDMLLNIDKIRPNAKHKELTKAYVIEAFKKCYSELKDKPVVIDFVRNQLDSTSPKTKKAAKEFLETL